ncbi:MAG: HAMP domain-containing histidine kinase [Clostridia bacterium]|nr:HAMP domain-containing histidine kinase [Clostridia bacterium]
MKDRSKRQKKKLLLSVFSVLLAAWSLISAIFCYAVVRIEINNQFNEEKYNEEKIISELQDDYLYQLADGEIYSTFYNDVEKARHKNGYTAGSYYTKFNKDMQLLAVFDCEYKACFDTDKAIFSIFSGRVSGEYDGDIGGLLDLEDFKASMSESDFKTIADALAEEPDEYGKKYYLVCTEFYHDEEYVLIKPKTVDLVYRENEYDWHMSGNIVRSFSLNPKGTEKLKFYKMDRDHSNIIPAEFVLDNFKSNGLIEFDGNIESFVSDLKDKNAIENPEIETKGPFTYIFKNVSPIEVVVKETVTMMDGGSYEIQTMLNTGYLVYAKQLSIFDNCKDFMFLGLMGIFIFFILLGAVMYIMLSKIINTQINEEKKRREISGALAHDIKTPLFIISGYAQNLKENINADKQEHYIDRIIERSKEVNDLVHKMLDLSRLASPDYVVMKESLDLNELVESVLSDYRNLNDNKSIKLSVISPSVIEADRSLMARAVTNLMENAVSYSDVQTVIGVELSDKYISVSNVSSLIAESEIKHLTEPYYRGEKYRKTKGNGLGLSVVKSIAEMHGFSLDISLNGNVITFKIIF